MHDNLLEFSGKAEIQQGRPFVSVHQNISAKVLEVWDPTLPRH